MAEYDPGADSSRATSATRTKILTDHPDFKGPILKVQAFGACPCGCNEPPLGKNRTFKMGHDARYRGKLIRAHLAGVGVAVQVDAGDYELHSPLELADVHGWVPYLEAARERETARLAEKVEKANARLLAKALADATPDVGESRLIRVGRWDYTGQVVAIYDNGDTIEFQYVTSKGQTKRVRKPRSELVDVAAAQ